MNRTVAAVWECSPADPKGEIVYTADAYRGVDVLRIDGGGLSGKRVKAPVPQKWFGGPTADSDSFVPHPVYGFMCPLAPEAGPRHALSSPRDSRLRGRDHRLDR